MRPIPAAHETAFRVQLQVDPVNVRSRAQSYRSRPRGDTPAQLRQPATTRSRASSARRAPLSTAREQRRVGVDARGLSIPEVRSQPKRNAQS